MKKLFAFVSAALILTTTSCSNHEVTSDERQADAQAAALEQAHAQVGMPAIPNFAEKRMMKDLYELRDKSVATHTYIVNEMVGCLVYVGPSVGYGLPYSTQFTARTRVAWVRPQGAPPVGSGSNVTSEQIPQPEPNGLYMPDSAEGTWVMLKDPNSDDVKPVYLEPRVVVAPFKLPGLECLAQKGK